MDATVKEDMEGRRLRSWKEIAAFFGADERTVKRWETQRALPVHRVPGNRRASVYAYTNELTAWLKQEEPKAPAPPVTMSDTPEGLSRRSRLLIAGGAMSILLAGVAALVLAPSKPAQTAAKSPPASAPRHVPPAQARELYLTGVFHLETRTAASVERAIGYFNQAIALDPAYAEAYAKLADAYGVASQYGLLPSSDAYPRAKAAAERALALDDRLPSAYVTLGFIEFYWSRNFARSGELFRRALEIDPENAQAHHWYALTLMHYGRYDEPIAQILRAQQLDPQSKSILANKALILFHAGRANEAIQILTQLEETQTDYLPPHAYLATIYLDQGRYQDFLREYRRAAELEKDAGSLAVSRAAEAGLASGGGAGMLRAMMAEQKRQFAAGDLPAFKLALTAAMLGDKTAALDYLDASAARQEQDLLGIIVEPALAILRDEPRYQALVKQVGF